MGFVKGGTQMNKHTRELIIALIIFFLITIFLFANIEYRNKTILEQENKIIDLQIELDNQKEITHQIELERNG